MPEYGLDLALEIFVREGDEHVRLVHFPLLPGAPVKPHVGVRPVVDGEGPVDDFLAYAVGAVRVGEVAGDEDDFRTDVVQDIEDDPHVFIADGVFLHLPGLVEGQVQEPGLFRRDVQRRRRRDGFGPADVGLDDLDFGDIHLPGQFRLDEGTHGIHDAVELRVGASQVPEGQADEIDEPLHVFVEYGDVPAGHVGDGNVVPGIGQPVQRAAHGDDVVVRMGREADAALVGEKVLAAVDLGADRVEGLPVEFVDRLDGIHQGVEVVSVVVPALQVQYGLLRLLA